LTVSRLSETVKALLPEMIDVPDSDLLDLSTSFAYFSLTDE